MKDLADTTQIALPAGVEIKNTFANPDKMDLLLKRIEEEALSHAPDTETKKGRDGIKSLAYKVAQSKTALDKAGKELNEAARAQIAAVDTERRKVRDRLDALKEKVRKPLTDWEAAEAVRVRRLEERLEAFSMDRTNHEMASNQIQAILDEVGGIELGEDWQEFRTQATAAKATAIDKYQSDLRLSQEREANAAELERLRAEIAKKAAEDKAREDRERAERERKQREEEERKAAEESERLRIKREEEEAERIEQARQEAIQAERKAAEEREAALKREAEEAKARADAAAEAERRRIEKQRQAEEAARKEREADAQHRATIAQEIAEALSPIPREQIPAALMDGRIPHVKVLI